MSSSKIFVAFALLVAFTMPSFVSAAALTHAQASAIIGLLEAFGADPLALARVEGILGVTPPSPAASTVAPTIPAPSAPTQAIHVPTEDNVYPASTLGFDLSFNASVYPATFFGFAVVGINGGKSFVHNQRIVSEFSWAHAASSVAPTIYMNLNAPFGSTVSRHIGTPQSCPGDSAASVTTASTTAPTACEGYNYGYNAAADAFAYAKKQNVSASFWWIDVEEANSWADATSTNDAVIQGALDYLNMQNIRVGIYSMGFMWRNIAGTGFTPTQTIQGHMISTPTWFPIGISTQVGATNACVTATSFIPNSPIWILQYEQSSTATDQNIAC